MGSSENNRQSQASVESLSSFELLPAIDISNGLSVRAGDEASTESYGSPLEIASDWISQGANWIHLVDLDAAFGRGENRKLISEVASSCSGIKVQVSGGIRDTESLQAAIATGAERINLATSALLDMDWVEDTIKSHSDRISVSLDVSGRRLIARGTKEEAGELEESLIKLNKFGCARYVVTDVARDGSLTGPNMELLEQVLALTSKPVIASGGISKLSDLEALMTLRSSGLAGAVLGKALYVGRFSLEQALQVVRS
ncbi:MAG: bifunctional 1-(5-phosphoribosyl)-5-((5-phosphoribosylamino)methylideneamino)imidazole-4-carboxamide isomerase/phosphoribosylanthranilate isomerase PriA [Actinobacteria bacterium]|uniref:1-(5-phosphoribosyl)-5-[(5-phosphoribosylamino)methylideneamino]imidazole-4-carboxamideisomerase n=1 Tax=freshwater metagenome TaxID=449393 RepID=A0A6J6C6X8_9ZZZZ|nr:bifunctional 1-(5-phosphoribosyl)-5-((5-phosphoribosylamino)methylideneamino)imidazole-4-carboxamide isomerase/phosphoribosylanthranilate isomerase PriA [Actinomycetota bacterium]